MRNTNKFVIDKIKPQIKKALQEKGLELFDVTLRSERGGVILRITIDTEKGAGIDDCTEASRAVSAYLDSDESIIPFDKYNLEVSTPGLERPLRTEADFKRFIGRKCKIVTKDKDEAGRKNYTGVISKAEGGTVTLEVEKESQTFEISIVNVSKANIVAEF